MIQIVPAVCALRILALFLLDQNQKDRTSLALWLPATVTVDCWIITDVLWLQIIPSDLLGLLSPNISPMMIDIA